jgi:uncharacterized repeat protein (TIGR01451 family)
MRTRTLSQRKAPWRRRLTLAAVVGLATFAAALVAPGTASAATCVDTVNEFCGTDFSAVAGVPLSGQIGTVYYCGLTVLIDWGDGSPASQATETCDMPDAGLDATLYGAHTYAAPGTYTVTLTAPGFTIDGQVATVTAIATVRAAQADLGVTMNAPGSAKSGSTLIYAITVSNAGLDPARNVTMVDQLPYGTVFQAVTAIGWICAMPAVGTYGGTVRCTVDPLAVGGQVATSIGVKVKAKAGRGAIVNAATVTSDTPDPNPSNNTVSVSTTVGK